MAVLIVYDIELEDGRKDLTWIEPEDNEEPFERFDMKGKIWEEVLELIQEEFGSKVIKYKWEFEKDEDDEDDDY